MDKRNIARKVQSLLALADKGRNNSDAEADLALSKAYELLTKYHLTLDSVHHRNSFDLEDDTVIETEIDTKSGSIPSKTTFIIWILQDHFRIGCIFHTRYVDGKRRRFISFIGAKSDIDVAQYVFVYLGDEFERRWKQHKNITGATTNEKKGFLYGVYKGFDRKLKNKRRKTAKEMGVDEKYLMKNDYAIEDYIRKSYSNLSGASMNWKFSTGSYLDGIEAGKSITVHSAVKNDNSKKPLLQITTDR